ncbi:protocatechuate 3,4-dioxygenase [Oceanicola sp. 502str15]|uniref:DODA-type extradiol aromatic ring-opening family dioxygenase n=1 Tax=Oceanicola sp. 502str15 TaxID=2696061 RepID=UPI002094336F|nr:protocatechuate 3,4-dioxygenase [Oceanicola sp. 502str15]MCO6381509.1 protocatechuate 3,4-dioxygenase [Oceanicola sp. 502str15]
MARIVGGFGISHTPSMGLEFDKGIAGDWAPHWKPWFDGTRPVKDWLDRMAPDRLMIVYNDHLNHFDFSACPTLAIGVSDTYPQADEGWGPRPYPDLPGDTAMSLHMTERLVRGGFDLTVCQDLSVDHGIYSWLPYLLDAPWQVPVCPLAVNMVRHPIPTSQRLWDLGRAIGTALREMPGDERVVVVGTGGMSHQISGARFGIANEGLDRWFLRHLRNDPQMLVDTPQEDFMRLGGTEASELAIWFAMRAALSEEVAEVYTYHTFPAVTGCGVVVYEEQG